MNSHVLFQQWHGEIAQVRLRVKGGPLEKGLNGGANLVRRARGKTSPRLFNVVQYWEWTRRRGDCLSEIRPSQYGGRCRFGVPSFCHFMYTVEDQFPVFQLLF